MVRLIPWVLAFTPVALSGCNTMAGFGKDVEKRGSKTEMKAEEKK